MAGVAATLLFSAGGAGGIALTYWALRKAGMRRRDVGRRMVAFVTLHYAFYPHRPDRLRGPAADRGAERQGLGRADDHPGRASPGCC